ncbi:MAG: DUF3565 domain-containing protein [Proteobacteria bacterium]|nr:DUF3565 domain-containing protein [Pseudomonadota bacterium]
MQRPIDGFHQDERGDWIAELRCGHGRHEPWMQAADGRATQLGAALACPPCERFELPVGHAPYKRTREFDQTSIPDALRADHSTKPGVWGVIHVLAGRLRYIVEPPLARTQLLAPGIDGIVVPEVRHRVIADGDVRFFVEFHRATRAP